MKPAIVCAALVMLLAFFAEESQTRTLDAKAAGPAEGKVDGLKYESLHSPLAELEMPLVKMGRYGNHRRDPRRVTTLKAYQGQLYVLHGDGYFDKGNESVNIYRYDPKENKFHVDFTVPEAILYGARIIDGMLYLPGCEFSQNNKEVNPAPGDASYVYFKDEKGWHWTGGVEKAWHLFDVYKHAGLLWCTASYGRLKGDPVKWYGRIFFSEDGGRIWKLFPQGHFFRCYYFFKAGGGFFITTAEPHRTYRIDLKNQVLLDGPDLVPDDPDLAASDLPWETPGQLKNTQYRAATAGLTELNGFVAYASRKTGRLYTFDGKVVRHIPFFSPGSRRSVVSMCHNRARNEIIVICRDTSIYAYTIWRAPVKKSGLGDWKNLGAYASFSPKVTAIEVLNDRLYVGHITGHIYRSGPLHLPGLDDPKQ